MANVKLKSIVSRQVPEFVREEHPQFVQFLEAYYEYLDQYERRDVASLRDLDRTLEDFILYIKRELDVYGEGEYDHIDRILLLRKIKEIFTAKGSEASYKFLFRILFDKPINISYPWDSVLKASDGKWRRDTTLFVEITSGNALSLVGKRVTIVSNIRKMFVYVDSARHIENNVFELFIEKNYYGEIEIGNIVQSDGVVGTILPTTIGYEVINPGQGYKVGDLIVGNTFAGDRTIEQQLKVTKVNTDGGILELITTKFGYGYTTDFFLYTTQAQAIRKSRVNIKKGIGSVANAVDIVEGVEYTIISLGDTDFTEIGAAFNEVGVTFTSTGEGSGTGQVVLTQEPVLLNQFDLPDDTQIEKYADYGQIINPNYWVTKTEDIIGDDPDIGVEKYSESTYAGTFLGQFYTETIGTDSSENYTLIRFDIGAVAKYQGYYSTNDGFLSDTIYIQDSRYYQKFSYLITVDERLEDYKALLKSFIHPSGTALFGEYQIQNSFSTGLNVSITVEEYQSKATFNTINIPLTNTFATATGQGGNIRFEPYDLETYFLEDYNPETQIPFTG